MGLFLATLLIVFCFTASFLIVGTIVLNSLNILNKNDNPYYHLGISFFSGAAIFLFTWSLLARFTGNALVSLWLVLIALAICVYKYKLVVVIFLKTKHAALLKTFLVVVFFVILCLFKSLPPIPAYYATDPEIISPFSDLGAVGHSFRAANFSTYIFENNEFPLTNQHSGQSILASAPMFLGANAPLLSLGLWFSIFIAFFTILSYGTVKKYFGVSSLAWVPVAIVLLGNTVLWPFYSSIADTPTALLLAGNFDGIFGVSSLLISILLVYEMLFNRSFYGRPFVMFGIFAYIWSMTAGQNIVLFAIILCLLFFIYKRQIQPARVWKIFLVFATGSVLGVILQGGFLMPTQFTDSRGIPGLMVINDGTSAILELRFPWVNPNNLGTLRRIESLYENIADKLATDHTNDIVKNTLAEKLETVETSAEKPISKSTNHGLIGLVKSNQLFFLSARVFTLFQIVFFPILGVMFSYYFIKRKKIPEAQREFWRFFLIVSSVLLFVGWVARNFFAFYGHTLEMGKFLHFGIFSSMLLLGVCLSQLLENSTVNKKALSRCLFWLLITFVLMGGFLEYFVLGLIGNFYMPYKPEKSIQHGILENKNMTTLDVPDRLDLLINLRGIFGAKF